MARSRISIPKKIDVEADVARSPNVEPKGTRRAGYCTGLAVTVDQRSSNSLIEPPRRSNLVTDTMPPVSSPTARSQRYGSNHIFDPVGEIPVHSARPGASPPVFEKMCSRWVFAVGLVMLSVAAVSASVRPANRLASRSNGISFCW
jgi:hypothetical protein